MAHQQHVGDALTRADERDGTKRQPGLHERASPDSGGTLSGTMTYANEGPIGFKGVRTAGT